MLYYHPSTEGFAQEAFQLQVLQVMQASSTSWPSSHKPDWMPHLALSASMCLQRSEADTRACGLW